MAAGEDLDRVFEEHFRNLPAPTLRLRLNWFGKRILDLVIGSIGTALTLPVIAVAAISTYLDTGRPVFYTQIRRGLYGKKIKVRKMRTMVQGTDKKLNEIISAEKHGRFMNIPWEADVYTRVGRILEVLWIVELPQLWSVLFGEMSLVGNRPVPDYVIRILGTSPQVIQRFGSPPGLTGYPQIVGREVISDEERIRLEEEYTRVYQTGNVVIEDIRIIARTIFLYVMRFFSRGSLSRPQ